MNWITKDKQLRFIPVKRKYNPYGDYDFDGTLNYKDCDIKNPAKDGIFGRVLGVVTGGRLGQTKKEYRKEIEKKRPKKIRARLVKTAKGGARYELPLGIKYRVTKTAGGKGKIGRPQGPSGRYINPITKQPVGVFQYRKVIAALRRRAKSRQAIIQAQRESALARRGLTPEQVQQMELQRQQAQVRRLPQQVPAQRLPIQPQQQVIPIQQVPRRMPLPRERFVVQRDRFMAQRARIPMSDKRLVMIDGQTFKVETDIMSGRKRLIPARQVIY